MEKKVENAYTEKHVTILKPAHDKLQELAKLQHRSMRGVATVLIEEALIKERKKTSKGKR